MMVGAFFRFSHPRLPVIRSCFIAGAVALLIADQSRFFLA
jgi:hypothetical protein